MTAYILQIAKAPAHKRREVIASITGNLSTEELQLLGLYAESITAPSSEQITMLSELVGKLQGESKVFAEILLRDLEGASGKSGSTSPMPELSMTIERCNEQLDRILSLRPEELNQSSKELLECVVSSAMSLLFIRGALRRLYYRDEEKGVEVAEFLLETLRFNARESDFRNCFEPLYQWCVSYSNATPEQKRLLMTMYDQNTE